MTIWLHTPKLASLKALSQRLAGSGAEVSSEDDACRLRERLRAELPLVLVFETACGEHCSIALDLQEAAPWARVVFLAGAGPAVPDGCIALAELDPDELTARLLREAELADIAKRRLELASERKRLERGLENAERLATIGRVAAGMAHEINNPLAVIRASAAYVAEMATRLEQPELGVCASDIEAAVERIGTFVQHVTGFARYERPQITDAPLHTALEIALRMIKPHAKEQNVRIAVDSGPRHRVPHDPPRLAQAILSLLSNAVEAASAGGGHVAVRVVFGDNEARVEIDDDGPGMAAELGERVFEPFATTKSLTHAAGLGLTITRQIAADHGGRIELERSRSGGVQAALVLPRFRAAVYRILVVHDEPNARRALATELRREGFDVVSAASLEAARECLRERPVHLVVAAAALPELGLTLVSRALSSASVSTRVLALCPDADLSRGEGADHALASPWERCELVRVARALCLRGERRPSREPLPAP